MARNEQLIRQHKLLQILERYRFGRTLDELRDELVDELGLTSLHPRSVRRDLEALQAAGIDLAAHDSGRGRVWKLGPLFRGTHKITASATELIALSLARDLLTPLAGTPFWIGIESFWSKVRESLPESVWEHYQKYRDVLLVLGLPAKSYEKQLGILKTINRSILEHRVVEIAYRPLGQNEATTRRIEPYGIALYQGSLYVIADACEVADAENRVRHLKLDRFRKAVALDEWFKPRADFQLAAAPAREHRHLQRRQVAQLSHSHQCLCRALGRRGPLASGPADQSPGGRQHGAFRSKPPTTWKSFRVSWRWGPKPSCCRRPQVARPWPRRSNGWPRNTKRIADAERSYSGQRQTLASSGGMRRAWTRFSGRAYWYV